jgi:hypothetical protein
LEAPICKSDWLLVREGGDGGCGCGVHLDLQYDVASMYLLYSNISVIVKWFSTKK